MSDRHIIKPIRPVNRIVGWLGAHAGLVIAVYVLVSAALVYPLLKMQPTATASQEPAGPLFEAHQLATERFASRTHRMVFIVEAREGNLLEQASLAELLANSERLRQDPELGPKLLRFPHPKRDRQVRGFTSIADEVEAQLQAAGKGGLTGASTEQVGSLLNTLLTAMPYETFGLSVKTRQDPLSLDWRSPAMLLVVLADSEKLGGGGQSYTLGTNKTRKEAFGRDVLARLRGEQRHYRVWGVAIDVNLTSTEQGKAAGPFIGFTILAALLLVGLLLRSYWSVAVVGLSLGALMLWLKGLSNLVGLKQDQILSTIVPIAMISFGVDFAFHAIGRYREAGRSGRRPAAAFRIGLAGALSALLLAMTTDAAAFLSNLSAGIESLTQFGIAAAMGTLSSFLLLGLFAPLVIMSIEQHRNSLFPSRSRLSFLLEIGCSVLSALGAMTVVILMVFIKPWLGAALLGLYGVLAVFAPALLLPRSAGSPSRIPMATETLRPKGKILWLGQLVSRVARFKILVLSITAAVTVGAVLLALRVDAHFDVKDFFSPRSDFVVGLGKFDEHVGKSSGEPALVYIEGPLHQPAAVSALREFRTKLEAIDTDALASRQDGSLTLRPGLLKMLDGLGPEEFAAIEKEGGPSLSDANADGIPDTPEQILKFYQYARAKGLSRYGSHEAMTADSVRTQLWVSQDGQRVGTNFMLRIPGSRSNENVAAARSAVEPLAAALQQELRQLDISSMAVFTGQPVARQASLEAIQKAFRHSLVIAVIICLLLAAFFMRSLRYGLISIVPILLVVSWLYAFMYLAGYSINVVTATIGAISIGVGIDFAVHLTMRYREELARGICRDEALYEAGAGTGGAILGAGLTSIVGFSILAFAPMPMFASYGLLTAVMIAMAVTASLLVLPSLLVLGNRAEYRENGHPLSRE